MDNSQTSKANLFLVILLEARKKSQSTISYAMSGRQIHRIKAQSCQFASHCTPDKTIPICAVYCLNTALYTAASP